MRPTTDFEEDCEANILPILRKIVRPTTDFDKKN